MRLMSDGDPLVMRQQSIVGTQALDRGLVQSRGQQVFAGILLAFCNTLGSFHWQMV